MLKTVTDVGLRAGMATTASASRPSGERIGPARISSRGSIACTAASAWPGNGAAWRGELQEGDALRAAAR